MFHTIGNTIAGGLKKGFFKVSYVAIEFLLRYPTINADTTGISILIIKGINLNLPFTLNIFKLLCFLGVFLCFIFLGFLISFLLNFFLLSLLSLFFI